MQYRFSTLSGNNSRCIDRETKYHNELTLDTYNSLKFEHKNGYDVAILGDCKVLVHDRGDYYMISVVNSIGDYISHNIYTDIYNIQK